jgi:hypothetical protein
MNYTHARNGYLEWYSHLFSPLDAETGEAALALMADRIDGLNDASEELTHATRVYLVSDNHTHRVTALNSLLHQIEGDLEAANMIWTVIEDTDEEDAPDTLTRSVRGSHLRQTLRRLATEIPATIEGEETVVIRSIAPGKRSLSLQEAIGDLRFEIYDTLDLINDRTNSIGIRMIRDILSTGAGKWDAVLRAVSLLQGHEKAGDVGWGLEDEVEDFAQELASGLRGILANVVEKILIVIEKNDLVRYTIADWLEDLRETDSETRKKHFAGLLEHLYQTKTFREHDLNIWLQDALIVERVHQATEEIAQLGDNFDHLGNLVRRLSSVISAGAIFANPTLLSVGLAIQIGLLGTLVFAGYDHIDEGTRMLNLTKGIKQILMERLPVSPQTIEHAESLRSRTIRIR